MFQTNVAEKIKTHLVFNNFFPESRAVNETTWKNTVEPGRPHMTLRRTRFACWIPKATNTHSEYVIFITFPLQQWLHECASLLRYTYTSCLVITARESVYFSVRTGFLTLRRLMSFIYGAPILDVSRSHTTTQHSR